MSFIVKRLKDKCKVIYQTEEKASKITICYESIVKNQQGGLLNLSKIDNQTLERDQSIDEKLIQESLRQNGHPYKVMFLLVDWEPK